ncbi:hypothetical protein PENSPDRAFT_111957 [Peniophora sp. CONT]|nr:hypothetical protein PENSPDRAFT_111957 [Peniophora sp. CONT]
MRHTRAWSARRYAHARESYTQIHLSIKIHYHRLDKNSCLPACESGDGEENAADVQDEAPREGPHAKRGADIPLGRVLDTRARGRVMHLRVHIERLDTELQRLINNGTDPSSGA